MIPEGIGSQVKIGYFMAGQSIPSGRRFWT